MNDEKLIITDDDWNEMDRQAEYHTWKKYERKTNMFHVVNWDTNEIIKSFDNLNQAKKYCRGLGHTGLDDALLTGYPPVAYVANDAMECVYNPRFGKMIGSAVGGLVIGNDDCLRG